MSKKQFTHLHSHKVVYSADNKAGINILICLFGNPSGGSQTVGFNTGKQSSVTLGKLNYRDVDYIKSTLRRQSRHFNVY